jgi:succinate dehydrogenase/fumarate reductase flavoprotein subunit
VSAFDRDLTADVLVIGGGPAATWAALTASKSGARVVLVDKGYVGTSGAAAPSGLGTWWAPTPAERRAAAEARVPRCFGLADVAWVTRTLDEADAGLRDLAAAGYPFPDDDDGQPYIPNLRTADYLHFMRRQVVRAGVRVFDHSPALELLGAHGVVAGATGIDRQNDLTWRVRAAAVVVATGGCSFGERFLGATGLTGDGLLMAAEAGATLSGMEFSAQYGIAPFNTSSDKGLVYFFATFTREDGTLVDHTGDRQTIVARALLDGPVYAQFDRAPAGFEHSVRVGQPNIMLPFDRAGIDPFRQRFPVRLRCEGTVRGTGGIRLSGSDCATGVPGLYAAGDVASRERLTGAISGGGGPNSAWTIASGRWAGHAAATFAREIGPSHGRRLSASLGARALDPAAAAIVKDELLPIERNFFRTGRTLTHSLARLDDAWSHLQVKPGMRGLAALRAREAAALTATARWSYRAALERTESRGMHRRLDAPATDTGFDGSITVSQVDTIRIARAHAEAIAS